MELSVTQSQVTNQKNIEPKSKKETKKNEYKNPIKDKFEYIDATKAAIVGGICLTASLIGDFDDLDWLADFDDNTNTLRNKKLKNKQKSFFKNPLVIAAIAFLGISACLTLGLLPKKLYEKKQEIFVKKKEADSFVRTNSAEGKIYDKLAQKAENATSLEKEKLYKQLMLTKQASTNTQLKSSVKD